MKKIILFVMMLPGASSHAQSPKNVNDAIAVLKKVRDKLNSIQRLSYHYSLETRYYADNYHYLRDADMYIEYTDQSPIGLRFQAIEKDSKGYVYNNNTALVLRNDMTIDSSSARTANSIQNNTYLYHSIAMLRNVLPLVIGNDSLHKTLRDTVIGKQTMYCIEIEGPKMYFGTFDAVEHFTADNLRRPYYLLVDKKSFLPQQFIAKYVRGNDDRDFVTTIYTNINTSPQAPADGSWEYSSYLATYKPYIPIKKKPLVATGSTVADFTLPAYTPGTTENISLKQYEGKVVLLDFWFKSCGPCMQAMPHYKELQTKMGKDFTLLTINVEDPVEDIKFFYNKYQPNYPMLFNGDKLFKSLGLEGCPSSVLLDKNGKVLNVFFGFDKEVIEKKVRAAL